MDNYVSESLLKKVPVMTRQIISSGFKTHSRVYFYRVLTEVTASLWKSRASVWFRTTKLRTQKKHQIKTRKANVYFSLKMFCNCRWDTPNIWSWGRWLFTLSRCLGIMAVSSLETHRNRPSTHSFKGAALTIGAPRSTYSQTFSTKNGRGCQKCIQNQIQSEKSSRTLDLM